MTGRLFVNKSRFSYQLNIDTVAILVLPVLGGLLCAAAFSLPGCGWLAWIGAAPFFYLLFLLNETQPKRKASFFITFLFGLAYFLPSISWFYALQPLGDMAPLASFLVLTLAWLLMGGMFSLLLAFMGLIYAGLQVKHSLKLLFLVMYWFLFESVTGSPWLFGGFPWVILGVSQQSYPWLIQAANLLGASGISAGIVAVNILLASGLYRKTWRPVWGAVAVFVCFFAYSGICLMKQPAAETAEVAVIHSDNTLEYRWNSHNDSEILENYLRLSYLAQERCKENGKTLNLILWPETALPYQISGQNTLGQSYQKLAADTGADLLIGGYQTENNKTYNTIFHIAPSGSIEPAYYKQKLVPFGEYTPFETLLRKVLPESFFDSFPVGNLDAGTEEGAAILSNTKSAVLICYDSIFPSLLKKPIKEGAEVITISSNEGWYADSSALRQNLGHGVLRAVEQNRFVLRSTNGGYSAMINNHGQVVQMAKPDENTFLQGEIQLLKNKTVYWYIGSYLPWLALAGIVIILAFNRRTGKKPY